ncbi:MAG TPA: 1-acyl-sn-glycerol-3-phosphate acyltransferase [Polyangiaceae bacterium]|nr:1-acyl-sn-glycerol-3-phosphate acyltransferase [Polyangiaceae bacterium]
MAPRRGHHRDRSAENPGVIDEELIASLRVILEPLVRRMWPGTFYGLENLPSHDRFMVVANHSAMGSAELWSLLLAWHDLFQGRRRVAGMAHPAAFGVPVLGSILRGLGAVEATREGARKAREAGVPLLLFPGGDHEAMRPLGQADRVDFAGRKGWIRLAREHGLAIVPMAITGSHKTLPILMRSRALSWVIGMRPLLGVKRAPLPVLSLASALAAERLARWAGVGVPGRFGAALAAYWATLMVPWIPARIGFHLMPPTDVDELAHEGSDEALYERVVGVLGTALKKEK